MKPRRGRPLLPSTQARLENEKLWSERRPAFAVNCPPSEIFKQLCNGDAFLEVRKGLGMSHKSYPDDLVIDVLKAMEGDSDYFVANTNALLAQKKSEISSGSKKGGQRISKNNLREAILANPKGAQVLNQFLSWEICYKIANKLLADLCLPIPDDRTLRRWRQPQFGHQLKNK
jgi:hypothetical protein